MDQPMNQQSRIDWRTIIALNATSTLSQIGQFGIGFVVLPLWLAQHGLNAAQLGVLVSAEWLGMLVGMAIAPRLNVRFGHRKLIAAGLLSSMLALLAMSALGRASWLPAVGFIGLGMGWRWIGLEPWLYRIVPSGGRGRLVGFHETLIGIAPILAPALTTWAGIEGSAPLVLGMVFTGLAFIPLALARPAPDASAEMAATASSRDMRLVHKHILTLGVAVAVIGGVTEAAFSGLFPIFGAGRGLSPEQMAVLLSLFGLGGLLLQYLMGWLADHRGLAFAILVNAASTMLIAAIASLPLGFSGLSISVFALGGTITTYLTLAIIASTKAGHGDLSINMRFISMAYTSSSILGPLIAGVLMKTLTSEALIWLVGLLAAVLCAYLLFMKRREPHPDGFPFG
jgi:MFS family permease